MRPSDHVLTTPVHDDSWCHTVGYVSPILVGAALARELRIEGVDGAGAAALLEAPARPASRSPRGSSSPAPGSTSSPRARWR